MRGEKAAIATVSTCAIYFNLKKCRLHSDLGILGQEGVKFGRHDGWGV